MSYEIEAKLHHKIVRVGSFSTAGSSFNISHNANSSNNEQVLVWHDQSIASQLGAALKALVKDSPRTVFREALRRNKYPKPVTPEDKESLEETEERIARQGLPPKSQRLILCRAALGKMGDVTPILKLIKAKT